MQLSSLASRTPYAVRVRPSLTHQLQFEDLGERLWLGEPPDGIYLGP